MTVALTQLGVKTMTANYALMQVTGHNIANANVAGYSRQSGVLSTVEGQFTGSGYIGRGAVVTTVARAHDAFMTREAAAASSTASMDAARLQHLRRLENVFKPGETGLGHAVTELMNAFADLSGQPGDLATRRVVLARAGELAQRFNEAGQALDESQVAVSSDLRVAVAEVNRLAQGIAVANQRLGELRGLNQPANDVLDERDRLIAELSQRVQVTRIEASDGSVGIFIGGGERLVLGARASQLSVLPDPADGRRTALAISDGATPRPLNETVLGGGSIAGMMRFQNEDLVAARSRIGQLAVTISTRVNAQLEEGLDLDGLPGLALFSGWNDVTAVSDTRNQGLGTVSMTITDAAALQASEYLLQLEVSGYRLTRLSDGFSLDVGDGSVFDGFTLNIAGAAASGDRFLLQPVSRAANSLQLELLDPRKIAAAALDTPVGAWSSNNVNAMALNDLRQAAVVGGQTFTDAWALALSDIGVRVQGAQTASDISTAVARESEQRLSAQSGVNLDEEAARLIQYQQSYQAASKMLQVAQSLFDTLMQATRT